VGDTVARSLVAGAATAAAAWGVVRLLGDAVGTATVGGQAVQVFGAVAVGLAVFAAAAVVLRIEEVTMVRDQLLRRRADDLGRPRPRP
jgi:hypothetical protein